MVNHIEKGMGIHCRESNSLLRFLDRIEDLKAKGHIPNSDITEEELTVLWDHNFTVTDVKQLLEGGI